MSRSASAASVEEVGIVWTDTRDMEWARFGGFDAGRVKPLHSEEDGNPVVMLVWLPPGDLGIKLPHRHLHRTVYECAYQVAGDLPHAEWSDLDAEHEVVVFREGFFMNRAPGSLHGNEWIFSDVGCTVLMWRSGIGNWLHEQEAARETSLLDPDDADFTPSSRQDALTARWGDGVVLDRPDVRIVSTREMGWEPMPEVSGARVRVLAVDRAGEPTVRMVFLPPGAVSVPGLPSQASDHEFAYLLEGELHVAGRSGVSTCRQGYFMNRAPGAPDGLEPAAPSVTGAVLLHWRIGPNSYAPPQ